MRSAAGRDDDAGQYDHKDPAKFDHGTNDFNLAKDIHSSDIDENDDEPEDRYPRRSGDRVGPEAQDSDYSLEFVGYRDPE